MNTEKVIFAFFIILAATLNFGFFLGEFHDVNHHNVYELFAALVISLIATVMKFGDRTHLGAVLLATSLEQNTFHPSNPPRTAHSARARMRIAILWTSASMS